MTKTIRIMSAPSDDNPHGFVVINTDDFVIGQHEPFGEEDVEVLRNWPNVTVDAITGNVQTIEQLRAEMEAEASHIHVGLIAERDRLAAQAEQLAARAADLDIEAARQREQAESLEAERQRLAEQGAAQAAEAQRLRTEAAKHAEPTAPAKGKASKAE